MGSTDQVDSITRETVATVSGYCWVCNFNNRSHLQDIGIDDVGLCINLWSVITNRRPHSSLNIYQRGSGAAFKAALVVGAF